MNTNPATAPYSFSQDGAAPCRGIEPCSPSVLSFMDTWISAPVRVIAPRDFTFKAVIGEPDW